MKQRELDAAVARMTGEDLRLIRQRGFSLAEFDDERFDPEPDQRPPQTVDWDDVELQRNVPVVEQRFPPLLVTV
jgi:hypothetical protein